MLKVIKHVASISCNFDYLYGQATRVLKTKTFPENCRPHLRSDTEDVHMEGLLTFIVSIWKHLVAPGSIWEHLGTSEII